jgi:HSP20 family protein
MELKDYDPYRAIGGASGFASFMKRARRERDDFWHPVLEAFHTFDDLVLRYEVPGVEPHDIEVRVDGRVLWVLGERRRQDVPAEELSLRDERTYGAFERSIALPEGTDPSRVRATYRLGVLEVRVGHVRRPQPADVAVDTVEDPAVDIAVSST